MRTIDASDIRRGLHLARDVFSRRRLGPAMYPLPFLTRVAFDHEMTRLRRLHLPAPPAGGSGSYFPRG